MGADLDSCMRLKLTHSPLVYQAILHLWDAPRRIFTLHERMRWHASGAGALWAGASPLVCASQYYCRGPT